MSKKKIVVLIEEENGCLEVVEDEDEVGSAECL